MVGHLWDTWAEVEGFSGGSPLIPYVPGKNDLFQSAFKNTPSLPAFTLPNQNKPIAVRNFKKTKLGKHRMESGRDERRSQMTGGDPVDTGFKRGHSLSII